MEVSISSYGGIITALTAPDRCGEHADVVLGFDRLDRYLAGHPYFGAIVGRYANRIAGGMFTLDGQPSTLARNNGENHLHGGIVGFDKVLWTAGRSRAQTVHGWCSPTPAPTGTKATRGSSTSPSATP